MDHVYHSTIHRSVVIGSRRHLFIRILAMGHGLSWHLVLSILGLIVNTDKSMCRKKEGVNIDMLTHDARKRVDR